MTANHTKHVEHDSWLLYDVQTGKALCLNFPTQVMAVFTKEEDAWKFLYQSADIKAQAKYRPIQIRFSADLPVTPKEKSNEPDPTYQNGRVIEI
jgi:hypothetical protein